MRGWVSSMLTCSNREFEVHRSISGGLGSISLAGLGYGWCLIPCGIRVKVKDLNVGYGGIKDLKIINLQDIKIYKWRPSLSQWIVPKISLNQSSKLSSEWRDPSSHCQYLGREYRRLMRNHLGFYRMKRGRIMISMETRHHTHKTGYSIKGKI